MYKSSLQFQVNFGNWNRNEWGRMNRHLKKSGTWFFKKVIRTKRNKIGIKSGENLKK